MLWVALAGPGPRIDGPALNAAIDTIVSDHIAGTGVPGVVVAVTAGKRVVVERGWGLADVDSGRPMDARTLVRIASLSKTFTATVVAQLEDAGRLDIDASVDDYLQRVSAAGHFDEPVTVRQLLAHTAGFINYNPGRVTLTPPRPEDFESFVARTMPPQILAPGTATLYSNHGNALVGLVVQDVTGMAFTDFVRSNLLAPLQMDSTAYYVDLHQPELSSSYQVDEDGTLEPWPYEYFATIPASAVHTTAHDMAQYLMLHAGDGRLHGRVIVPAAAMERMRAPHPTIAAGLGQYHYAFSPTTIAGRPARAHGGSVPAFLSRMVIFDDAGVGVFVAQNAFGPRVAKAVIEAVAHALPEPEPTAPPQPVDGGRVREPAAIAGLYRVLSKHETAAFTRPVAVLSQPSVAVEVDPDGFLRVEGRQFVRTGEHEYQSQREDGRIDTVVFVPPSATTGPWLHRGRASAVRPPWHGRRDVQIGAFALALVALLGGMVTLPRDRALRLWSGLALAALLGAVVPQAYALIADAGQPVYTHPLRLGIPVWIPIVLWLPRVAAVLAVAALMRKELRSRPAAAIALGSALLVALEQYWRLPAPGLS